MSVPQSSSQRAQLEALLGLPARRVEADLREQMIEPGTPPELAEAMQYAVLGGGKRLRPAMVALACQAAGGDSQGRDARLSAMAVEMIHCYSLVHDDLPAMDDDQLRRGLPTVHVKFGQAMAILVGDALLTRALGLLAGASPDLGPRLLAELAAGAGPAGMIAGQVADMALCQVPDAQAGVEYVQARKTAALIRASAALGATCARADDVTYTALTKYAEKLGMVFQVVDDLLDATGSARQAGKRVGKDAQAGKRTHVSLLGVQATQALAQRWTDQAIAYLAPLGAAGDDLAQLARLLSRRIH